MTLPPGWNPLFVGQCRNPDCPSACPFFWSMSTDAVGPNLACAGCKCPAAAHYNPHASATSNQKTNQAPPPSDDQPMPAHDEKVTDHEKPDQAFFKSRSATASTLFGTRPSSSAPKPSAPFREHAAKRNKRQSDENLENRFKPAEEDTKRKFEDTIGRERPRKKSKSAEASANSGKNSVSSSSKNVKHYLFTFALYPDTPAFDAGKATKPSSD
ncbi:hypothetical protein VKT23_016764 [Stygiomarasmius scandens]|uniref:Uncharacterized protein n=1 Tax=Marasmiellus scandens TaxID=2682957 RepID=A0ABR1IYA3_9AGAR